MVRMTYAAEQMKRLGEIVKSFGLKDLTILIPNHFGLFVNNNRMLI